MLMIDMFSVTCVVIIPSRGCVLVFVDMTGISEDFRTLDSISSRTATGNLDLLMATALRLVWAHMESLSR